MSFSFTLASKMAVSLEELEELVGGDARWRAEEVGDELRGYWHGLSTRGVAIESGGDAIITLRVNAGATRAECVEIAKLVAAIAARRGCDVVGEGFGAMPVAAFRDEYAEVWAAQQGGSGWSGAVFLVDDGRGPIQVPACVRTFWIGARFVSELRARGGGDEPLDAALERACLFVQYPEEHGFVAQDIYRKRDGDGYAVAPWLPGTAYLMPPVDHFLLRGADGTGWTEIPWAHAASLPETNWTFIDEKHATVSAISADAWPAFIRRATERT